MSSITSIKDDVTGEIITVGDYWNVTVFLNDTGKRQGTIASYEMDVVSKNSLETLVAGLKLRFVESFTVRRKTVPVAPSEPLPDPDPDPLPTP